MLLRLLKQTSIFMMNKKIKNRKDQNIYNILNIVNCIKLKLQK